MKTELKKSKNSIINTFACHDMLSKGEIVENTGFSPALVSTMMNELENEGIVYKTHFGASSGGRRPMMYRLGDDLFHCAAYKITTGGISLSIINIHGDILASATYIEKIDDESSLSFSFDVVTQKIKKEEAEKFALVKAVAITLPGIMDNGNTTVSLSVPLCLKSFSFDHLVRKTFGKELPIKLFKDSDSQILAEYRYGTEKAENMAYVFVDDGIGFSMIQNGRLLTSDKCSMELGHTVISVDGEMCRCGRRGCAATILGGRPAARRYADRKNGAVDPQILTYSSVIESANNGEDVAKSVMEEQEKILSILVINVINLFAPSVVVIGGAISKYIGLSEMIQEKVDNLSLNNSTDRAKVSVSHLDMSFSLRSMAGELCKECFFTN